ncbi:hypothetical protein TRVA0_010S00584 [Trichomonascus vanleenenianus]|uniref:CDP-diacylglycerol-serine O-phosphatidyltransferase n=1 Tax=Trichomonascus vanleenenianus TaxID=2268995 RepID=UPI003ECAB52B
MVRNLHMADFITCLNGLCGFMSIVSSLRYAATGEDKYAYRAMYFSPLGMFFDFLDGRVARWRNKSSLMGQELDSLADLISFGLSPACCAFNLGLQTTVDTLLLAYFVLCGLTRLARFNVTVANIPKDEGGKSKYFEGTPIPTTIALVIAMAVCYSQGLVGDNVVGGTVLQGTIAEFHPIVFAFVASGSAMISKSLKVPKI